VKNIIAILSSPEKSIPRAPNAINAMNANNVILPAYPAVPLFLSTQLKSNPNAED